MIKIKFMGELCCGHIYVRSKDIRSISLGADEGFWAICLDMNDGKVIEYANGFEEWGDADKEADVLARIINGNQAKDKGKSDCEINPYLLNHISDLCLIGRAENPLKYEGICYIWELLSYTLYEVSTINNLGGIALKDITDVLATKGLSLGMLDKDDVLAYAMATGEKLLNDNKKHRIRGEKQ